MSEVDMTQGHATEQVMSFLFNQEGVVLRNVKLFVGDRPDITDADLVREMHSALVQERMRKAKVSAEYVDSRPTVNVESFLASL
jgi:hypothetical protein